MMEDGVPPARYVCLSSAKGDEFRIEISAAKRSVTLRHLLNALDEGDEPIPLPNIDTATLGKVVAYLTHHSADPDPHDETQEAAAMEEEEEAASAPKRQQSPKKQCVRGRKGQKKLNRSDWDIAFMGDDWDTFAQLAAAAHYLNIPPLHSLACKTMEKALRGKSVEEMRRLMGVENDFTPEEEATCRAESAWMTVKDDYSDELNE